MDKKQMRTSALSRAKLGFQRAMRNAQYESTIGEWHYAMDRDEWAMRVQHVPTGTAYAFPIRKSWEA